MRAPIADTILGPPGQRRGDAAPALADRLDQVDDEQVLLDRPHSGLLLLLAPDPSGSRARLRRGEELLHIVGSAITGRQSWGSRGAGRGWPKQLGGRTHPEEIEKLRCAQVSRQLIDASKSN